MAGPKDPNALNRALAQMFNYGANVAVPMWLQHMQQKKADAAAAEADAAAKQQWQTEFDADEAYRQQQLGLGRRRLDIEESANTQDHMWKAYQTWQKQNAAQQPDFGVPKTYGEHLGGLTSAALGAERDLANLYDPYSSNQTQEAFVNSQFPGMLRNIITDKTLSAHEESGGAYTQDMINEAYKRYGRESIDPRFQTMMLPDPGMGGAVPLVSSGVPAGQEVPSRMPAPMGQQGGQQIPLNVESWGQATYGEAWAKQPPEIKIGLWRKYGK